MFNLRNKSFNVKMIDDPKPDSWVFNNATMKQPIDWDKASQLAWIQTRNIALCVGAVFVAKNVSLALGQTFSNVVWRIVDVKFPYPPIKY